MTRNFRGAAVRLKRGEKMLGGWREQTCAGTARWCRTGAFRLLMAWELQVEVKADGKQLISPALPRPPRCSAGAGNRAPAAKETFSADELFITGLHLDQYRHATRQPEVYWQEALRRDPGDARSNNALGLWHLRRGEFAQGEAHFHRAIARLTRRNANPYDGEPITT